MKGILIYIAVLLTLTTLMEIGERAWAYKEVRQAEKALIDRHYLKCMSNTSVKEAMGEKAMKRYCRSIAEIESK